MTRRQTVTSVFESLLADLGSDASRRAYRSDWSQFVFWLKCSRIPVLKVSPKDVKRYVVYLAKTGKAQKTRGRALSVIREVYRSFVAEELLAVNPAREVKNTKQGKGPGKTPYLEEDDLAKFLAYGAPRPTCDAAGSNLLPCDLDYGHAGFTHENYGRLFCLHPDDENVFRSKMWTNRRDRMVIQLLAGTGRRRSEVARMLVEDFSADGVTGQVKGGAIKTAPVPNWLRQEIADWCSFVGITSGPLLPRGPDDPSAISGDAVYLIVKRVARAVGVDPTKIAPHGLRRSLATLSERRDVPLADIQAQLGHVSRQTTETYLKGSRKVETAPGEWMSELVKSQETP